MSQRLRPMQRLCILAWKIWGRLSYRIRLRWRRFRVYGQGVCFGKDLLVEPGVEIHGGGELLLGDGVWLGRGVFINVWRGGRLVIEDDAYIGRYTVILARESVRVGAHTMVAPYAYITDVNHGTAMGTPMRHQPLVAAPVDIGEDVWFGAGCSVVPGVTIGRGCVVGARAVVTKSLPENAIAVGVPARIIRIRGEETARTTAAEATRDESPQAIGGENQQDSSRPPGNRRDDR
ncbi:MAG: acyltransferase [Phycisphaerales bacterium]|nr:MAG: acyltransferase [Phycisphaerales bacterium]